MKFDVRHIVQCPSIDKGDFLINDFRDNGKLREVRVQSLTRPRISGWVGINQLKMNHQTKRWNQLNVVKPEVVVETKSCRRWIRY